MDGRTFGRGVVALRQRQRWRQQDLADRSRVSRSVIARIEQGHAERITVATLDRVAAALEARVVCRLAWRGEELDRLLDAAHAATVEQVVRLLVATSWLVATEVSFNEYGERGSVDVLAFHPSARTLLVVEVKSVVPDVQATLLALDRKVRLGPKIARSRGWTAARVGHLLVIRESRTSRRRIDAHRATFGNAFPQRTREVRRWIADPTPGAPLRGLWFVSVDPQAVGKPVRRPQQRTVERGRCSGN